MKEMAIVFEKVGKSYGKIEALKGISFSVPKGLVTGLLGSNGSGKTTSIKCILDFYSDYSGKISVLGEDAKLISKEFRVISYIPDRPVYYEELTVEEHFEFISAMYETGERVNRLVEAFELKNHLHKFPHELSKGTVQKLIICCALLRNFEIIIADEPFDGLDPKQIIKLRDVFKSLADEGKTVLLSSHLLSVVEPICDYYIIIDDGNLISQGFTDDEVNSLEELYVNMIESERNEI